MGSNRRRLRRPPPKKIEAFEMWLYRRIQRIHWTERIINTDVLRRMIKEKEVLNTVKTRKLHGICNDMTFCRRSSKARYMELEEWAEGEYRG